MSPRITSILASIYRPREADACAHALSSRLAKFRSDEGLAASSSSSPDLSERDAILITYGDQISAPAEAPLRTLALFAHKHLENVVSGIHLLPFFPWSSDDGFSVKDYHAVDPALGGWDDVATLGRSFDLMFDAVLNHMSAESAWFRSYLDGDPAFRDFFIEIQGDPDLSAVIRPRALPLLSVFSAGGRTRRLWTTFSSDQIDLNYANPAVLLASVEVILDYVAKGARFIRLDAIAFLWKEIGTSCLHRPQTHAIVRLWRAVLDEVAPHVQLITETNVPHLDNLRYFGDGFDEAQLVYNFALPPLVLHALQTGDAHTLTMWAKTLAPPSGKTTFFNFLASHDGIGLNPARGILTDAEIDGLVARTRERGGFISNKQLPDGSESPYEMNINFLDALTPPGENDEAATIGRFVAAHAAMFSLRGIPGLYFHSLFGSRGDPDAARTSGIKRRINREKMLRASLETVLADSLSLRSRIFRALAALLAQRRSHPAFAPRSNQRILDLDPRLFALVRETSDGRDRILCLHNFSNTAVSSPKIDAAFPPQTLGAYEVRWVPASPGLPDLGAAQSR